jgi:hypothetical protein
MQHVIENLTASDHFRDSGIHGRIKLNWILKKPDMKEWYGLSWLTTSCSSGCCEE